MACSLFYHSEDGLQKIELTKYLQGGVIRTMNVDERKKIIKHHLVELGISFREWCRREDVPHSVARDIVIGRLDGSRSEKSRSVKEKIAEEFGQNIF